MKRLLAAVALGALPLAPAAAAPSAALAEASRSLDGNAHCIPFRWETGPKGEDKAAITLMAEVEGKPVRLQLDTGADYTILYGKTADQAGWVKPDDGYFRPASLKVAGMVIARRPLMIRRQMGDGDIQGTLGLESLIGSYVVIDYPGQRFCMFEGGDLPAAMTTGAVNTPGMLRNRKFFIPVSAGSFSSRDVVFDTGSSQMPLNVDLSEWRMLTGRPGTEDAPTKIEGTAWGKPIVLPGAPSVTPLKVGTIDLGKQIIYTEADAPDSFSKWPFKADGIVGNAALWDGIVVLDLTVGMQFGFIR